MSANISTAAHEGKLFIVRQIVQAEPSAVNSKDEDDRIPLHWAASGGHLNITEYLLLNGSKVDAVDDVSGSFLSEC